MRVSESEKLGVSVLGCHFSEKAEHIPIKKRRFLFKAPSPPRHETSPRAFNQEIKVNPNPNPICVHESVTQVVKKELVKAKHEPKEDDDFSGISILAAAACSNSLGAEADRCEGSGIGIGIGIAKSTEAPPTTIELKESISKCAKEESDCHTSRKESESMMDNSVSQPSSESVIPTPKDVRFNWDLNTVMDDPWEEPFVSEHEVSSHNNVTFIKKDDRTKVNSRDCKLGSGTESGIPSKDIIILNDENELKLGSSKLEPMSCELDNSQHSVAVAESAIPVTKTLTLENPTPGIFSKWQTSCDTEAVDTKLSMDCSVPPGFDHRLNLHISKENMVAESPIPVPYKPEFEKHDLSLTSAASMENGALSSKADESMVKMEFLTSNDVTKQIPPIPSIRYSEAKLENGIGFDNSRGGSGYDSQYEDGELRESSINAWKGEEHELVINNMEDDNHDHDLNIGITDSHESKSSPTPCTQVTSPGIKPEETDLTSSVVLPEILDNNTDEVLTGSEPNEMVTNSNSNSNSNERQEIIHHQSDEWKMNVSGLDHLPENQRIPSSNFTKTRNFTGRKFSYGEQKDGFDLEDMETKGEGSRFYRKEPITRIGGPSTRDVFLTRGRFRVQGCSSNAGERESGVVRSMGRGSGRYSPPPPHNRVWNRSPDRKNRLPSPTYPGPPFLRPMLEDSGTLDNNHIITEPSMDPTEPNSRPNTSSSYLTRRPFRSRSPMNREANDFRARLGLRPTADTSDHRFMTRGRGRGRVGIRYGTRVENNQPGRYHRPGSDECDEFITDYPNPFPRRRRCFSPVERRGSGNGNHYSGSRSPSRPRTRSPVSTFRRRSRSPSFRIRRPRSPNYRRGFDPEFRGNTSPPLNPRWVNYKERPTVFVERERERFSFYERKPKQNEFYRSGQRFDPTESGRGIPPYIGNNDDSETDRTNNNNGYRRGGFVRRYNNMDGHAHGHVKRFHYDDGDGFGRGFDARDKHALEAHARGNMKSSSSIGTSTDGGGGSGRFRDFSRRSREEDRRKDSSADPTKEEKEKHIVVKDQSNLHPIISVKEKEGDSSKTNANVGL